MKVKIETITDSPKVLKETVKAQDWDMSSNYLDVVDEIRLECKICKINNVVTVDSDVEYTEKIVCARCLDEVRRNARKHYQFYIDNPENSGILDIDPLIREELLLEYPLKTLCRSDCKGICKTCGANLNIDRCTCKKEE